ncbi:hypothetical protein D6D23_06438 [Aureobasidium pullulans]|nr:hypothetical protein D6D23_06438 [Aureobasidium pullulans]
MHNYLAVLWEDGMHNILAIVCSKRVTAPCSMFVCSDCIGNLAGRVNSASNTGFVYKHVKYLIGTLCNVEAKKRGMSNEILASHANRNALYAQVERDLAEQGTSCLHWKSAFTGKIYNIPTERITFRYHTSHPSPDAFFPYSTFNNAWLIRTKNNVGIVERPLNYARHIRLPTILWLLQRNLAIEECYKCVCQKGITPDLKALNVHDALVVKKSNNMRQICYKSAYTRCNRLNRSYDGKVLLNDYEK